MASFSNLIGSFMQNAMSSSGSNRLGNALGQLQGSGQGGGLDGVLGQLGGGLRSAANNPLQAGGIGAVTGALLGGRGGAVGGGALGLLASVAMQAMQGAGQQPQQAAGTASDQLALATRTPESPQEVEAVESQAQLVLKGMINAAKSDGQISPAEMQRILGKLEEAGADAEMQQWVMSQMAEPLDLAAFIAEIPSAEVAAEVYAGSLLAIEVDTDAERAYLKQLAEGTGLHPLVVNQIHQTLGVAA
jgi:uncharacterized membrane protein YebE (DUF533 family)